MARGKTKQPYGGTINLINDSDTKKGEKEETNKGIWQPWTQPLRIIWYGFEKVQDCVSDSHLEMKTFKC